MQPDKNKALIYDDNCPLCKAYTGAFVKGGFLKEENRISFSKVNMHQFNIDWNRARHEIPLINLQTGEVKYGVDALVDILQQKFFCIKSIMKVNGLNWFFRKLYKLISYNRKIIVAAKEPKSQSVDCTPDYSFKWRWLLIFVCYSLSNLFTVTSTDTVFNFFDTGVSPWYATCWMIVPSLLSLFTSKKTATDIHAHASVTATVTGSLLLFVTNFLKYFYTLPSFFYLLLMVILVITAKQIVRRYMFVKHSMVS